MLVWALLFPCLIILGLILGSISTRIWFLFPLAVGMIYVFQFLRLSRQTKALGFSVEISRAEAFFLLVAKFAHCAGAATFLLNSIRGKRPVLMEYK